MFKTNSIVRSDRH